jgi:hypothetical protein
MIGLTDLSNRISLNLRRGSGDRLKRLTDQIAEYENAAHDYVQDGVRLLELAKRRIFCSNSKIQAKSGNC